MNAETMGAPTPQADDLLVRRARRLAVIRRVILVALAIQLLLGVANNLWLSLPAKDAWRAASPGLLLWAHIVVGTAVVVLAIWILVLATRLGNLANQILAWATTAGVVAAWISGASFVTSQLDVSSFLMATGFAVALVAAGWPVKSREGHPNHD